MSILGRTTLGFTFWWRVISVPIAFALAHLAIGAEFEGVYDPVILKIYEEPAELIDKKITDCLDEMEQECLEAPVECEGYYSKCSPSLTAELEAMAKSMASQGIVYQLAIPQFYQGVAHGGAEREFEYGGKVDQFFILDGGKLGLWEGSSLTMHVETRYGDDVNREAVGFAPANVAMLYPHSDEHDTAITGFLLGQYLDENNQLAVGKFNALDMFYGMYPQTGRGVNGFMNASMVIPISTARVVPLSFVGAGYTNYYEKKPRAGVLVFDNQDVTTTSGFDDMFDNGANIMGFYRFFYNVGGLPGSQMFGGIWATGDYVSFDPLSFVILPGQGIVFDRETGAYTLLYILEQMLWTDGCPNGRNVGLLSQWGLADETTSPISWSCNVAIQATGLNRYRPQDSIGVGYFHTGLSDTFKNQLAPAFTLQDVDGVELYYNAALAPCFQLTADLQVIEPADTTNNTAVVVGLRGTIGL